MKKKTCLLCLISLLAVSCDGRQLTRTDIDNYFKEKAITSYNSNSYDAYSVLTANECPLNHYYVKVDSGYQSLLSSEVINDELENSARTKNGLIYFKSTTSEKIYDVFGNEKSINFDDMTVSKHKLIMSKKSMLYKKLYSNNPVGEEIICCDVIKAVDNNGSRCIYFFKEDNDTHYSFQNTYNRANSDLNYNLLSSDIYINKLSPFNFEYELNGLTYQCSTYDGYQESLLGTTTKLINKKGYAYPILRIGFSNSSRFVYEVSKVNDISNDFTFKLTNDFDFFDVSMLEGRYKATCYMRFSMNGEEKSFPCNFLPLKYYSSFDKSYNFVLCHKIDGDGNISNKYFIFKIDSEGTISDFYENIDIFISGRNYFFFKNDYISISSVDRLQVLIPNKCFLIYNLNSGYILCTSITHRYVVGFYDFASISSLSNQMIFYANSNSLNVITYDDTSFYSQLITYDVLIDKDILLYSENDLLRLKGTAICNCDDTQIISSVNVDYQSMHKTIRTYAVSYNNVVRYLTFLINRY